jgi:hypothetical protein
MPRVFATSVAVIGAFVAQSLAAPQQQVFRSTADVVPLFVTAAEKGGRLVTDLTRDDFQVFDNGKLQPLTQFRQLAPANPSDCADRCERQHGRQPAAAPRRQ